MALQLAAHRAGFGLRQASEFSPPADMALEGDGFHRRVADCDQFPRRLGGLPGGDFAGEGANLDRPFDRHPGTRGQTGGGVGDGGGGGWGGHHGVQPG